MLEEEVWLRRLANEAGTDQSASNALWSALVSTLEEMLISGASIHMGSMGTWSVVFYPEVLIGIPKPTHMLPPKLCLNISAAPFEDSIQLQDITPSLHQITNIAPELVANWLQAIPRLSRQLLQAGYTVPYPTIGTFTYSEGTITFSVDESFAKRINKVFSVFTAESLREGMHLQGLEHKQIDLAQANLPTLIALSLSALDEKPTKGNESDIEFTPNTSSNDSDQVEILASEQSMANDPIESSSKKSQITSNNPRERRVSYSIIFAVIIAIIVTITVYLWARSQERKHVPMSSKSAEVLSRPTSTKYTEQVQDTTLINAEIVPIPKDTTLPPSKPKITALPSKINKAEEKYPEDHKANNPANSPQVSHANINEEVEIKADDSLASLAQRKYGHRAFWVYIYEENRERIPNPHNVPIGTRLILPPAKKYNIDPHNTKSVNQALILSRGI